MDNIIKYELSYTSKNNILTRNKITNLNTKKVTTTAPTVPTSSTTGSTTSATTRSTTSATTGSTTSAPTGSTTSAPTGSTTSATTGSTTSAPTGSTENVPTVPTSETSGSTENVPTVPTSETSGSTTTATTGSTENVPTIPTSETNDKNNYQPIDITKKMLEYDSRERTWSPLTESGDTNIDHDEEFDNNKFNKYFKFISSGTTPMELLFSASSASLLIWIMTNFVHLVEIIIIKLNMVKNYTITLLILIK